MIISRDNYEIYFIGYLDGTLSDSQIAELEGFLLKYPDLREELEGMENVKLIPENYTFPDKELLYRIDTDNNIYKENFDDYCIAYLEGDLQNEQISSFESYMDAHPEAREIFSRYSKTMLKPDYSVIYQDKDILKKRSIFKLHRSIIYPVLSTAAVLAIILLITRHNYFSENINHPIAFETESTVINPTVSVTPQFVKDMPVLKQSVISGKKQKMITKIKIPESAKEQEIQAESEKTADSSVKTIDNLPDYYTAINLPTLRIEGARQDQIPKITEKTISSISSPDEMKYQGLPDIAFKYLNDKVLNHEDPLLHDSEITLWDIAYTSIEGINRLTGSSMKLEKQMKESGEAYTINFDAGIFGFSRTFR